MLELSNPTFHIIFVRGSVRLLRPLAFSHAARTRTVRLRLVSNGCTRAELRLLHELGAASNRVEVVELSRNRVLPHGVVLNELHAMQESSAFAFLDSDCFATGDWLPDLVSGAQEADAVFAGRPIWSLDWSPTLPAGFGVLSGAYDRLSDGACVGGSYFAAYDSTALRACMRATGVSFREYRWRDVPDAVQGQLVRAGKRLEWYDTGKLLNIMLGLRGAGCENVTLRHLRHIGAISSALCVRRRRLLVQSLDRVGALGAVRRAQRWLAPHSALTMGDEERRVRERHTRLRETVSAHFWSLLRSLDEGRGRPSRIDRVDADLARVIRSVEREVMDIYASWTARDAAATLSLARSQGT